MKFEKLTNNKIKIYFSNEDMNLNNISKKTLFSNNSISQDFIQSIIKSAEQYLDFQIDAENILVEILNHNDGYIFTITQVNSNFFENIGNNIFYRFNCFEDFLSFCTYIKNMNWSIKESFSLFILNNAYYLHSIHDISDSLDTIICEFCHKKFFSSRIYRLFK